MTQNPFDALGGGDLDINALMRQAQEMQQGIDAVQKELETATFDGSVAGGAVTVTVTGLGEVESVKIRPGQVNGEDQESLDDLGDLIVAAVRDSRAKAQAATEQRMKSVAGDMPGLPKIGE